MPDTIVLAYSGGLDTSFLVPWLGKTRGLTVVTVTADTGGLDAAGREQLAERAARLGAAHHRCVDVRARFFDETLSHLLMGNVLRGHMYPLCVGAERGLQARVVAGVAREIGAVAVAHGSTAAGNDQVRFEVALRTLAPELAIVAPVRDCAFTRAQELAWLHAHGFDWPSERPPYSINSGLWGTTIGGRETDDTIEPLPEEAWVITRGAFDRPRAPRTIRVGFERGRPVALDGRPFEAVALVEELNALAGGFGIGRGMHLGDTILGLKGRVAFEAPAAAVLIAAHRELEKLTLTREQQRVKDGLSPIYGELVHEGQTLEPACRDIEALFRSSQARVTGEVRVLLRPGSAFVEGVASPYSLRGASKGTYGETAGEWTSEDARGFSRLRALPGMLHARAGQERS